jgi:hypothetical protein
MPASVNHFFPASVKFPVLVVFDDRQLVTGLPGTMIGGLRHMQN